MVYLLIRLLKLTARSKSSLQFTQLVQFVLILSTIRSYHCVRVNLIWMHNEKWVFKSWNVVKKILSDIFYHQRMFILKVVCSIFQSKNTQLLLYLDFPNIRYANKLKSTLVYKPEISTSSIRFLFYILSCISTGQSPVIIYKNQHKWLHYKDNNLNSIYFTCLV